MLGDDETLYLVWYDDEDRPQGVAAAPDDPGHDPDVRRLDDGLFLVRTDRTRSQLYHDVKRRTRPQKLLVAPLAGAPKFTGLADGALKWVRGLGF